jgi:hypothetical protein
LACWLPVVLSKKAAVNLSGATRMSCITTGSEQSVDDSQCELLWILSAVYKGFCKLKSIHAVFSDVFSGFQLRRQLLDLVLDALEVREHVLLNNLNASKPVDHKPLVFLFVQWEVLEHPQKLLVKCVVKHLQVLCISSYVILIELLALRFRVFLGFGKTRKERMVLKYIELLLQAIRWMREVR